MPHVPSNRASAREALLNGQDRIAEGERTGRRPQASPTTHDDCAGLYGRAADAAAQAVSDYDSGNIDAARAGLALAKELIAAGDSCVLSAEGGTVEV